MNLINQHLDKNNLHHAYLIEGDREIILPEILEFMNTLNVKTFGNPDFCKIVIDSFKIEDAKKLKAMSLEKGFNASLKEYSNKKVFVLSANNFLVEAQNTLLKIFEEPTEDTHFFVIVPNVDIFVPTLKSRFYIIKSKNDLENGLEEAKEFLKMPLNARISFIKKMIAKKDEDEAKSDEVLGRPESSGLVGSSDASAEAFRENISLDSNRSKAIKFLNALETVLHKKLFQACALDAETVFEAQAGTDYFYQIIKAREYLQQPGSSTKNLIESVAIFIPLNTKNK